MERKIVQAARAAKAQGYTHIASVVKSVHNTTYYHPVAVDDIIEAGRWIPAPRGNHPTADGQGTWHGMIGVSYADLPDHTILRTQALRLVD